MAEVLTADDEHGLDARRVLVDPQMRPRGYATLWRILSSGREVRLRDIPKDSCRTVAATMPPAAAAYLFNQYHRFTASISAFVISQFKATFALIVTLAGLLNGISLALILGIGGALGYGDERLGLMT